MTTATANHLHCSKCRTRFAIFRTLPGLAFEDVRDAMPLSPCCEAPPELGEKLFPRELAMLEDSQETLPDFAIHVDFHPGEWWIGVSVHADEDERGFQVFIGLIPVFQIHIFFRWPRWFSKSI